MNSSDTVSIPDELLTADSVRRLFAISDRTLMTWVAAGKLPRPIKIGCRTYFHPTEIQELLDRSRMAVGVAPDTTIAGGTTTPAKSA